MQREFDVAVGDIAIGLDPDLYPLLASTQTLSGGSNVIGVQDPTLDRLLATAREPGTEAERKEAYTKLQEHLTKNRTCSRWPSRTRRRWSTTWSPDRSSARFRTPVTDFGMC